MKTSSLRTGFNLNNEEFYSGYADPTWDNCPQPGDENLCPFAPNPHSPKGVGTGEFPTMCPTFPNPRSLIAIFKTDTHVIINTTRT